MWVCNNRLDKYFEFEFMGVYMVSIEWSVDSLVVWFDCYFKVMVDLVVCMG